MKLLKLQSESRRLVLEYRNQDRIFQSEAFEEAWSKATSKQRDEITYRLLHPDIDFLKKWIKEIMELGYYKLTVKELRRLASYRSIPKYSRLLKDQLIKELEEHDSEETAKRYETASGTGGNFYQTN